jgi:hypothetical protein
MATDEGRVVDPIVRRPRNQTPVNNRPQVDSLPHIGPERG